MTRAPDWSPAEIEILKEFYPAEREAVIERLPGRTLNAVQIRASRLKVRLPADGRRVYRAAGKEVDGVRVPARSIPPQSEWNQAHKLTSLPWLKMPTTPTECMEVLQAIEAQEHRRIGFFESLRAYIEALRERLQAS